MNKNGIKKYVEEHLPIVIMYDIEDRICPICNKTGVRIVRALQKGFVHDSVSACSIVCLSNYYSENPTELLMFLLK